MANLNQVCCFTETFWKGSWYDDGCSCQSCLSTVVRFCYRNAEIHLRRKPSSTKPDTGRGKCGQVVSYASLLTECLKLEMEDGDQIDAFLQQVSISFDHSGRFTTDSEVHSWADISNDHSSICNTLFPIFVVCFLHVFLANAHHVYLPSVPRYCLLFCSFRPRLYLLHSIPLWPILGSCDKAIECLSSRETNLLSSIKTTTTRIS